MLENQTSPVLVLPRRSAISCARYPSLMNQSANTNRRLCRHWLLSESVIEAGGDATEIPSLIPYATQQSEKEIYHVARFKDSFAQSAFSGWSRIQAIPRGRISDVEAFLKTSF